MWSRDTPRVKARPSYVAQVLQQAGHLDGYFDLYTTTGREQNVYTRYFRNVLHFRNVEAAAIGRPTGPMPSGLWRC